MNTTRSIPRRLVLASASPRRRQMLADMGVTFEAVVSHVPEVYEPGETPEGHVSRLAAAKADAIAPAHPDALVLGVDTTVVIDGQVLGKPDDTADAERMLALIAGRTHTVFTAYTLVAIDAGIRLGRVEQSRVTLRALTPERIRWYVGTGEPMDKAGSYAIQGIGASLVRRVEGSYTAVVGLPLAELIADIESLLGPDWLDSRT